MNYSRILHIDLETYSPVDLSQSGVYRYAESPDFEILLFAYSYGKEVTVIDLIKENIPDEVLADLFDSNVLKVAHNAAFERTCLSGYLGHDLKPEQWCCTMAWAQNLGLPASLAQLGKVLGLPEDKQKMTEGKRLIRYFCMPCKPTKTNGGRTRNMPYDDVEKWDQFMEYNRQDVVTEMTIYDRLAKFPMHGFEKQIYCLDQRINDHGVLCDMDLVRKILGYGSQHSADIESECVQLTGGLNINSVSQLKEWLSAREGKPVTALTKSDVTELLRTDLQPESRRLLELRQEAGKTSVKKYEAFDRAVCRDDRLHGMFQYYGTRTGRWAGRIVQPQNLPRNLFDDFDYARDLVKAEEFEAVEMLYGSINDVFSTLVRTVFIPPEGMKFAVADYSAIEARVVAWVANEKWRQEVFRKGGDIYCESASQMFKVPVVKHGVNGHLRSKGKIAELALGYGGGVGALKAFGADKMGMTDEEMDEMVQKWRNASPNIRRLWQIVENAVKEAVTNDRVVPIQHHIKFYKSRGILFIRLPSGRSIAYVQPKYDADGFSYAGLNQTTRQWQRISAWGGKLVENIIQAIARDCLAETMLKLDRAGYQTVMHVHDEVIVEVPAEDAKKHLETIESIMGSPIPWAEGLYLTADGFTCDYYRKD